MINKLNDFYRKPKLFAPSTNQFWDDEYISKILLDAHLNPNENAATRKPAFLDESAAWIMETAPPKEFKNLLDLGCGPGLYAERFRNAGYNVTGIDFSKRSIKYAKEQSSINKSEIAYFYQDYLTIDYDCCYDIVTMIYCDFGVLSTDDRLHLLSKVYKALKPEGKFIFDVFTPNQHQGKTEKTDWEYHNEAAFWDRESHLCLNSFYRYDEDNTICNQTIVMNENSIDCYNIWEHCFTKDSLLSEVNMAGFHNYELYGDISGKHYDKNGNTICAVLTK